MSPDVLIPLLFLLSAFGCLLSGYPVAFGLGGMSVVVLGALGTGGARALAATLAGRVGAPRMSTAAYFIPIVAIVLGITFRGETIAPVAVAGVAVVLIGAYAATRAVGVRPTDRVERGTVNGSR